MTQPAFPVPGLQNDESFNGMSLRDYFAAKAMQSWITAAPTLNGESKEHAEFLAAVAYLQADAMLKVRSA